MTEPNDTMKRHLRSALVEGGKSPEAAHRIVYNAFETPTGVGPEEFYGWPAWRALELATQEPPDPIMPIGWERVDELVGTIEEIIAHLRESPSKPTRRVCANCKHWSGDAHDTLEPEDRLGGCKHVRFDGVDVTVDGDYKGFDIETNGDFGCIKWEPTDET